VTVRVPVVVRAVVVAALATFLLALPPTAAADGAAVSVVAPADGALVTDRLPLFEGSSTDDATAEPGVTVNLYAGTAAAGSPEQELTALVMPGGSWSVPANVPLADGLWTAQAERTYGEGDVASSTPHTFRVDASPPLVTLASPADGTDTADSTPVISGSSGTDAGDDEQVTVRVYAGSTAFGAAVQILQASTLDGGWSTAAYPALADGPYTVIAEQDDAAGNTATTAGSTFRVDTTPPSVTIDSPGAGGSTPLASPAFRGTGGSQPGDGSRVTLRVYEGSSATGPPLQATTATIAGHEWSVAAPSPLVPGTYTARAEQIDGVGNYGRSAPVTFTVVKPYRDEVMADSPRGYWRLGESSGTAAANVTGATGATYLGGFTLRQAGALSGDPDTAAQFNGVNGTVRIPSSTALNPTTAISLEAWVKPAALPATTVTIMRKGAPVLLRLGSKGAVSFRLTKGGTVNEITTANGLVAAGDWTHVVGTWDGATMKVYVNATQRASGALTGSIDSSTDTLQLGSSYGSYDFHAGGLDETALYGTALSQARVVAHYNRARLINSGAPNVTLAAPVDGSAARDGRLTFSGAAGTGAGDSATVQLRLWSGGSTTGDPVQVFSATRSGGDWSIQPAVALADGTYTARAEQANDLGNTGRSSLVTFLVDASPPTVTLTSPASSSQTFDRIPTFEGGAGGAPGDSNKVALRIFAGSGTNGAPVQTVSATTVGGTWSARPSAPLSPGIYTAQVEQADDVGNTSRSAAVTFTVLESRYRAQVMADQPNAYWRLGESSGTQAASETQTNAGTYLNGVALGTAGAVPPDSNKAASFDGVNDNVRMTNATNLNPSTALSLEAWVKPSSQPAANSTIVRKATQYLLRTTSTGVVAFRIYKAGAAIELSTASGALSAGSWHHVVATWDGAVMAIYVDGKLRGTRALSGPADAGTDALHLGASYGSYDFYAGGLDDVAVYGSALSQSRVEAHFDAVERRAPEVTLDTPSPGSTMESRPNFGGVAGTALGDAGSVTVKLYAGTNPSGTPIGAYSTEVRSSGAYSVQAPDPLGSGTYTVQAEQIDQAATVGRSAAVTFTVDAGADPVMLAAGDIAGCETTGDEATSLLLDGLPGTVQTIGDHAYEQGSPTQFANCFDPTWGRHKARIHPSVGDHDYGTPDAAGYFNYFGAAASSGNNGYYSYELGAWHIVVTNGICSEVPGGCQAGSPQDRWLIQDLASHPAQCTLGVIAGPRFSSGATHGSEEEYERMWQDFYGAGADVILSADDHIYERFAPQTPDGVRDDARGLREFVVGTGGRSHYDIGALSANSEAHNNDTFGILKLTLHASGYDWRFVPQSGKTFGDAGSASCH
jgi:hypothetical protein